MPALRFLSVAALAAWIGGLAALGAVAAPEIFATLEARDPAAGRALAGEVFGGVFQRFQYAAWGLGGLLLALLGARAAIGPRPRRFGLRMWTVAAMLAASLAGGLVVAPRIDAIRAGANGAVASLPDADPRKAAFGRLHGLSNALMLATLAAGLWLLWAETTER